MQGRSEEAMGGGEYGLQTVTCHRVVLAVASDSDSAWREHQLWERGRSHAECGCGEKKAQELPLTGAAAYTLGDGLVSDLSQRKDVHGTFSPLLPSSVDERYQRRGRREHRLVSPWTPAVAGGHLPALPTGAEMEVVGRRGGVFFCPSLGCWSVTYLYF